jgi:APA family basic amino acid/polyamine antiporter
MARDGLFPRKLALVHSAFDTPAAAIICQSAWASVLILFFGSLEQLVVYTGFALTAFTTMAAGAVIVLRTQRPQLARPFRVPGYPWVPIFYVGCSLWIVIFTLRDRPKEALFGIASVIAGLPFYISQKRLVRRRKLNDLA